VSHCVEFISLIIIDNRASIYVAYCAVLQCLLILCMQLYVLQYLCYIRGNRSHMVNPPSILDDLADPDSLDEMEDVTGRRYVECL